MMILYVKVWSNAVRNNFFSIKQLPIIQIVSFIYNIVKNIYENIHKWLIWYEPETCVIDWEVIKQAYERMNRWVKNQAINLEDIEWFTYNHPPYLYVFGTYIFNINHFVESHRIRTGGTRTSIIPWDVLS